MEQHSSPLTVSLPTARAIESAEGWLLAVACASVAALYQGCFSTSEYLWPIAGAALAGAIVAELARWRKLRMLASFGFSIVAWLAYLGATVLRPTLEAGVPGRATWQALREGLVGGWLQLLTTPTPIEPTATLLVFPIVVSWFCGWAAIYLAWTSKRVLVPLLPALVALVVSLVYGAADLAPTVWVAAVWTACTAASVLIQTQRLAQSRTRETGDGPGIRPAAPTQTRGAFLSQVALGVPTIAIAMLLALALSTWLPLASGADRFDPRSLVENPFQIEQTLTPLAMVQGQLARAPALPLYEIGATGPRIDRVRVAALDKFDGFTWTSRTDSFLPAGRVLANPRRVENGQRETLKVRVVGRPEMPFLPVVGEADGLSGSGLGYSSSGNLAAQSGPAPGLAYSLSSVVRPYGDLDASARVLTPEEAGATYVALPPAPPVLATITGRITQNAKTPYEQVSALARYLRSLPYDAGARSGHSYGVVTRMLAKAKPSDANAYAEQHAAAFVVMARILKIPARLAVGYLVDGAALAGGKKVTVTTTNVHAWAEVPIEGYGWVPFETVDLTKARITTRPEDQGEVTAPDKLSPVQLGPNGPTGPGGAVGEGWGPALTRGTLSGVLLLGVLLVVYVLIVLGEKQRRRWSRKRAVAGVHKILGAWGEARDRLVERGVRPRPHWTEGETAQQAVAAVGPKASACTPLAALVSEALFAPAEPNTVRVAEAWRLTDQLRREMTGGLPLLSRIGAALDPRPLIPHSIPFLRGRPFRPAR